MADRCRRADASGTLGALAPLLLDLAIIRAVRKLDFAAARGCLARAVHAGIRLSPLALQTAQMLTRLAASTGALGLSRV